MPQFAIMPRKKRGGDAKKAQPVLLAAVIGAVAAIAAVRLRRGAVASDDAPVTPGRVPVPRLPLAKAAALIASGEPVVITDLRTPAAANWSMTYLEDVFRAHDPVVMTVATDLASRCCRYYEPRREAIRRGYPYPFKPKTRLYKDTFAGGVASVLSADYRGDGSGADMVVCALDGEVRGYRARAEEDGLRGGGGFVDEAPRDNLAAAGGAPPEEKKKKASFFGSGFKMRSSKKESKDDEGAGSSASRSFPPAQKAPAPQGSRADLADGDAQEETLVALNQRRQDLLIELKSYERNAAAIEAAGFRGETATSGQIPRDTKVESRLEMRPEHGGGELVLRTNNDTVIKAAVLFGESVFEEEIRFMHFGNQPSSEARVSIRPPRDVAADLAIKALVAGRSSPTYHVFELDFKIPRFCMYAPLVGPVAPEDVPSGTVTFRTPERVTRIAAWVDDAFKTNYSGELGGDDDADLRCGFFCLRDETRLLLEVDANSGTTVVRADVMETAGNFVQEMCASLGVEELQSEVDFPYDMEEFRETLKRVEDRDRDRGRLAAETADSSNAIKAFVIKAEDARILNDTTNMRRMYGELFDLNRELIVEHGKRAENHEELLAALREVNQMIQRAAKMRAGRAKTKVVAACRKAIKQNNTQALFQIIAHGAEEAE